MSFLLDANRFGNLKVFGEVKEAFLFDRTGAVTCSLHGTSRVDALSHIIAWGTRQDFMTCAHVIVTMQPDAFHLMFHDGETLALHVDAQRFDMKSMTMLFPFTAEIKRQVERENTEPGELAFGFFNFETGRWEEEPRGRFNEGLLTFAEQCCRQAISASSLLDDFGLTSRDNAKIIPGFLARGMERTNHREVLLHVSSFSKHHHRVYARVGSRAKNPVSRFDGA